MAVEVLESDGRRVKGGLRRLQHAVEDALGEVLGAVEKEVAGVRAKPVEDTELLCGGDEEADRVLLSTGAATPTADSASPSGAATRAA